MFESLENRRLLAYSLNNHVLTINGTEGDDRITFWQPMKGVMRVQFNDQILDFPPGEVGGVLVDGGVGNDYLSVGKHAPNATLVGGRGNDTLVGGPGDDRFYGGAHNDLMFGNGGDD